MVAWNCLRGGEECDAKLTEDVCSLPQLTYGPVQRPVNLHPQNLAMLIQFTHFCCHICLESSDKSGSDVPEQEQWQQSHSVSHKIYKFNSKSNS